MFLKTHDYCHHYNGYRTSGARCRIEIYQDIERDDMQAWQTQNAVLRDRLALEVPSSEPGQLHAARPLVIAHELPDNRNTSITNMVEYLAAEIARAHFGDLFESTDEPPFLWVECYPADGVLHQTTLHSLVTFGRYRPRIVQRSIDGAACPALKLEQPNWKYLPPSDMRSLIAGTRVAAPATGTPLADMQQFRERLP